MATTGRTNSNNAIINERFDRIETKIDKLSEAMVSLARTEEKIIALDADKQNLYNRVNRHSEKLDELTMAVAANSRTVATINKLMWILIAGAVATGFKVFLV